MTKPAALPVVGNDPWWMPSVVQFVQHHLKPQHMVLEFGSGASTIWLAERAVVYSVEEENIGWYQAVEQALHDNDNCAGSSISWQTEPTGSMVFDWLFLDGGDRVQHGLDWVPRMKKGGHIVLDDSERFLSYYPLLSAMNPFPHHDFYDVAHGSGGLIKPRKTTIWHLNRSPS